MKSIFRPQSAQAALRLTQPATRAGEISTVSARLPQLSLFISGVSYKTAFKSEL